MLKMDLIHFPEINGFVLSQPTKFFCHYAIEQLRAQFIGEKYSSPICPFWLGNSPMAESTLPGES